MSGYRIGRGIRRGFQLRCPVCGESPMFVRARDVRSFSQWFAPLERCEIDNYKYEREPGFFLLAIWAIDYVVAIVAGVATLLVAFWLTEWTMGWKITAVVIVMVAAAMLAARKAKGMFLALDLGTDPLDSLRGEGPPGVGAGAKPDS